MKSQNRVHGRYWEVHSRHGETAVAGSFVTFIHKSIEKRFRLERGRVDINVVIVLLNLCAACN